MAILAETYTVSAGLSLNNETSAIDYKIKEDAYVKMQDELQDELYNVDVNETIKIQSIAEQNLTDNLTIAKSYLIKNDILSRKSMIYGKDNEIVSKSYEQIQTEQTAEFEAYIHSVFYTNNQLTINTSMASSDIWKLFSQVIKAAREKVKKTHDTSSLLLSNSKMESVLAAIDIIASNYKKKLDITFDSDELEEALDKLIKKVQPYDVDLNVTDLDELLKSDLVMMLYKCYYGVIPSRSVILNLKSIRNGMVMLGIVEDYFKKGDNADFSKGDYYVYKSPNVYELYLKESLDLGLISKTELELSPEKKGDALYYHEVEEQKNSSIAPGKLFIEDYNLFSGSNRPEWYAKAPKISGAGNNNALGYSERCDVSGNSFLIKCRDPNYFKEESMTTLEAFQLIETFMRASEKDISDTEAAIVTYKYGLTFLDGLSASERRTVSFLIAKGVVNYEDAASFINLYGTPITAGLYEILYRVANKDARLDFSEIQLTDSDSYWQALGFSQDSYEVYRVESEPIVVDEKLDSEEPTLVSWYESFFTKVNAATASTTKKYFSITKYFDTVNSYKYGDYTLNQLYQTPMLSEDVSKVKRTFLQYNGESVPVYKVVFRVCSSSQENAVLYVEKNLKCETNANNQKKLSAVTKVKESDGKKITLIPQSSLRATFSDISIIEDKVLQNNATGALAVILPKEGMALVGNKVIKSEDLLITDSQGITYYNLEVIISLLSNSFVKKIGVNGIYLVQDAKEYSVAVEGGTDSLGKLYYTKLVASGKDVETEKDADFLGGEAGDVPKKGDSVFLYKVDSVTKGINTIHRTFSFKSDSMKKATEITVIIDWRYAIPSVEQFNALDWLLDVDNTKLTVDEASKILNERPNSDNKNLQTWWDSNYGISNALANFIYGTKNEIYVNCGYLTPSMTILVQDAIKGFDLQDFFETNNFKIYNIGDVVYDKYVGGSTYHWWKNYYRDTPTGFEGSKLLKSLAKDYRSFKLIVGQKSDFGYSYGTSYAISLAGVVYRNFDSDPRINYVLNKEGTRIKEVSIAARTVDAVTPINGAKIMYNGNEWIYRKTVNNIDTLANYLILQPNFGSNWFNGTISHSDSSNTFHNRNTMIISGYPADKNGSNTAIQEKMRDWYKKYFRYDEQPLSYFSNARIFALTIAMQKTFDPFGKKYFMSGDEIVQFKNKGLVKVSDETREAICDYSKTVYGIPCFYLPVGEYYFYRDTANGGALTLGKGYKVAALCFSNFYYSGLNDALINQKISDYVGTVKIETLVEGSRVQIGDTVWVKEGNFYVTQPLKNSKLVAAAKKVNTTSFQSKVAKLFVGMYVKCAQMQYPLSNYFSDYDVAPKGTLTNRQDKAGVVTKSAQGYLYVYKKGKQKTATTKASYVAIKMKINSNLLVRPLDAKGTLYTITYSVAAGDKGSSSDLDFFDEDLSFDKNKTVSITLSESKYSPSQLFLNTRDNFMMLHHKAMMGDVWSLIKFILLAAASYLAIMSWVSYGILNYGVGRPIFDALALPTSNGRNGVDMIKVTTFGFYNLDDELSPARVFIVTMICFVINYVILNLL